MIKKTEIYILEAALACADLDWCDFEQLNEFGPNIDRQTYARHIADAITEKTRIIDLAPEHFEYKRRRSRDEFLQLETFDCPCTVDDYYACLMAETKGQPIQDALDEIRQATTLGHLTYLPTHQFAFDDFERWLTPRLGERAMPTIFRQFRQEARIAVATSDLCQNADQWTPEMRLLVKAWQHFWSDPNSKDYNSTALKICDWLKKESPKRLTGNKAESIQILIRPAEFARGGLKKT